MHNTKQNVILSAGCHRSGSTWLFNVVREACLLSGSVFSSFEDRYRPNNKQYQVVKIHEFSEEWKDKADTIVTMRRDLRGIAASAVRVGLIRESECVKYLRTVVIPEYDAWKPYSHLEVKFEDILSIPDKVGQARRILEIINISADPIYIIGRVEALPIPEDGKFVYDPVSLYHPRHISLKRSSGVLSNSTLDKIVHEFKDWLLANQYLKYGINVRKQ